MTRRSLVSSIAGFFFAPTVKPEPVLLLREVGDGVYEVELHGEMTPDVVRALNGKLIKKMRIWSSAARANLP